jgi:quinoprotein relay system zinc metallohydrolase 1
MNISNNLSSFSQKHADYMSRLFKTSLLVLVLVTLNLQSLNASELDYKLVAEPVGKGTYVFIGSTKYFSKKNGGNIANAAYIVTNSGVIVIDTGSSYQYGKQMREYIESTTGLSIIKVFNTHHHPDHFLGNQAYKDVPIASLQGIVNAIDSQGDALNNNLYTLVGDWMKETESIVPSEVITPGKYSIGEHDIEIIAMNGHTDSDMVIYDHTTGVLFAGDLVFHNRTPAVPNANIENWLNSIRQLQKIDYKYLISGHGPVTIDERALVQTRDYLSWLHDTLQQALDEGLDISEAFQLELPESFESLDILHEEYKRAVLQLYPSMEQAFFN